MLGAGLAMDAFSVSVADALGNPQMKKRKMLTIAGTFGFFQFLMPLIGWLCVKTVVNYSDTEYTSQYGKISPKDFIIIG